MDKFIYESPQLEIAEFGDFTTGASIDAGEGPDHGASGEDFFKNFPQFIVIHTVKGFGIVNKAEIDVFF